MARASDRIDSQPRALPADAVFQIIVYHSHARPLIPLATGWLSYDGAKCRARVAKPSKNCCPRAKRSMRPALNLALAMRPDVVFFLTDADDLSFELLRQVEAWNHGRAIIHAFELNGRRPARHGHADAGATLWRRIPRLEVGAEAR